MRFSAILRSLVKRLEGSSLSSSDRRAISGLLFGTFAYPAVGYALSKAVSNIVLYSWPFLGLSILSALVLVAYFLRIIGPRGLHLGFAFALASAVVHGNFDVDISLYAPNVEGLQLAGMSMLLILAPTRGAALIAFIANGVSILALGLFSPRTDFKSALGFFAESTVIGTVGVFFSFSFLRTMDALEAAKSRLAQILESLPEGVVMLRGEGELTFANEKANRFLRNKLSAAMEVKSAFARAQVEEEGQLKPGNPIVRALAGDVVVNENYKLDTDTADERWLRVSATPIFFGKSNSNGDGSGEVLFSFADITHTKRTDLQLRLQQSWMKDNARLAALGEMAAGIGHEINNPLGILSLQLEQVREDLEGNSLGHSQITQRFDSMGRAILRISKIVSALKGLARDPSRDELVTMSIQSLWEECFVLVGERLRQGNVKVNLRIDPQSQIRCKPGQMIQVLINLVNNAVDAVEGGPMPWITFGAEVQEQRVVIYLENSGAEIPDAVRLRVMEPFFTTKPRGKGTGLGLSISAKILEDFGGRLLLHSQRLPTRFEMWLPIVEQAQLTAKGVA